MRLFSDLHVEGLFRVPGNSLRQQALKELLNSGADVDLESGGFHPHDVASLLKSFLGELPEPLLTHRHFHAHLKIAGRASSGLCSWCTGAGGAVGGSGAERGCFRPPPSFTG